MSKSINNTEDDGMDMSSVSDNFEITREEESSLLQEDSMTIDSPLKSSANNSINRRKPIVFDLDQTADDNETDDEPRDKFRSERKTITFSLNDTNKREIPDTLDGLRNRSDDYNHFKRLKNKDPKFRRNRKNKWNNRSYSDSRKGQPFRGQEVKSSGDLRQLIDCVKQQQSVSLNRLPNHLSLNPGLSPLMDYQMNLGILNPVVAQNQMLVNALLAQNPLLNRISIGGQNLSVNTMAKKDDIRITVANEKSVNTGVSTASTNYRPNLTKAQTKSQIRCRVTNDETTDSTTDSDVIVCGFPSMPPRAQTSQKGKMSTLFAKHLANKSNDSKSVPKTANSGSSSSGLFGDALAEVAVGVDNEYLRRMEEQEKKRLEIKKRKEERRLEMADERLESALQLKQKIQRSY